MAIISVPTTWSDSQVLTASALNGVSTTIYNDYNGNITNANISATAAIALTKLASTPATLTGSETLTNKTLTKPTVNGSVQGTSALSPDGGATQNLNGTSSNVFLITMPAGNITLTVSNITAGQFFYVRILQDSGGSRTVSWFSTILWAGNSAPTLTTTGNKADFFAFFAKTSSTFDAFVVGQNI